MAKAAKPVPDGYHTITPQLTMDNAAKAIDWYKSALGAQEVSRSAGPDGRIMHAELKIGDSRFMLNDAMGGAKSAKALGGSPSAMWVFTEDADALFNRAVKAGGQVQVPLADQFWGDRGGALGDPEGYTWWIATRKEDLTPAELNQRAEAFFRQAQPTHG